MALACSRGSHIATLTYQLDTWHGSFRKEITHLCPVIRWTKREPEHHFVIAVRDCRRPLAPQITWRATEGLLECAVEAANTFETRGKCNVSDWQLRLINQAL